ncbi:MAG: hypothetical protein RL885_22225 [Planctomycetota bacterium]
MRALDLKGLARVSVFLVCSIGGVGLLSSCKKSSSDPVPASAPQFDQFVRDLISATSDDTDPVDVNDREFQFDEDPAAFDDLFESE